MKKPLILFPAILALSLTLYGSVFAQCVTNDLNSSAKGLASSYINALFAGNTEKIPDMLSSKLREEKLPLLTRRSYPQQLTSFYDGAQYEIIDCGTIGDGTHVTIKIIFPTGNNSLIELWMNKLGNDALLIYNEVILP